jgi:hypothetical protein
LPRINWLPGVGGGGLEFFEGEFEVCGCGGVGSQLAAGKSGGGDGEVGCRGGDQEAGVVIVGVCAAEVEPAGEFAAGGDAVQEGALLDAERLLDRRGEPGGTVGAGEAGGDDFGGSRGDAKLQPVLGQNALFPV